MKKYILLFLLATLLHSCNKNSEILQNKPIPPTIELENEDGIFVTKVGKELIISPTYQNVENAIYSWIYNQEIISEKPELKHTFNKCGIYYVLLRVSTPQGKTEEEIRIDVKELAPPIISLVTPPLGFNVLAGYEYHITPDIQNADEATFLWKLNDKEVGRNKNYTFKELNLGSYKLTLTVTNEDGKTEKTITIRVVNQLPIRIEIPASLYFSKDATKYIELGRTLFIRAYVFTSDKVSYQWDLNGEPIEGANSELYGFNPQRIGDYTLTFRVKRKIEKPKTLTRNISISNGDETNINIKVSCLNQAAPKRPFTSGKSLYSNKVYEYVPAPGQFINETINAGFNGEQTHEAACHYAQKRLEKEQYVSLGGFGGYLVVGFDHSIENKGDYDFSIKGNAFNGSCEPGIVWVMQDVNGNGIPDDEWYELKGSEHGKSETMQDYAVIYSRPSGYCNTPWSDNKGNSGVIDRLSIYHPQEYYYPLWIQEESYTLFGTCLKARTVQNSTTGNWENNAFDWGYADNIGNDMSIKENPGAKGLSNFFKISDAICKDGSLANLTHIDFIKVQTGIHTKAGRLGEGSTEVLKFCDENNNK